MPVATGSFRAARGELFVAVRSRFPDAVLRADNSLTPERVEMEVPGDVELYETIREDLLDTFRALGFRAVGNRSDLIRRDDVSEGRPWMFSVVLPARATGFLVVSFEPVPR